MLRNDPVTSGFLILRREIDEEGSILVGVVEASIQSRQTLLAIQDEFREALRAHWRRVKRPMLEQWVVPHFQYQGGSRWQLVEHRLCEICDFSMPHASKRWKRGSCTRPEEMREIHSSTV